MSNPGKIDLLSPRRGNLNVLRKKEALTKAQQHKALSVNNLQHFNT